MEECTFITIYRRGEAAGKVSLPSGANALQARRETPDFWRGAGGTFLPSIGGQKSVFLAILSSRAAGLPCPFYLASLSGCKEKGPTRLGTGFASGVTWGFFPFCQVRFASLTNRRPKGGEIVPCGHKLPCLPRPYGACLLDVCADADTAPRYRPPQTNIQAYGLLPLRLQCHMKHPATHLIPSHKQLQTDAVDG